HWALEGADLYWGDVFGDDCRLVGYENDGCPLTFGEDGLPRAVPRLGVPENLEIIATAPVTLGEPRSEFGGLVPPEPFAVLTRAREGFDSPENRERLMRGHAVLATFKRGMGEVFNSGTTEWAYGLKAGNPFVDRITRNVLDRALAKG
ncbi:N,N-dimethylformamidase beta subunit family domain-containing protein, partial [Parvibaculum sp.]|uniref:N,N-dimethylformamidase beta subunit family domain-containing protein n=1 Tax=Parvibaculum sp. TaxID=2024848 RepID=UPI002CA7F3B3